MAVNAVRNEQRYTYKDYLTWDDDKRWEIIDGVAYMMSPPMPSNTHQEISGNLYTEFSIYLKGKKCKVYHPPFDVTLPKEGESFENSSTVVQPDITIVCDPEKTKGGYGCKGAPDLVIEILSPSTSRSDKITKYKLYERNAIKEYWIVDPVNHIIDRFTYDDNLKEYKKAEIFTKEDNITPTIFPDLEIRLEDIFPELGRSVL